MTTPTTEQPKHTAISPLKPLVNVTKAGEGGDYWTPVSLPDGVCFDVITPAVISEEQHRDLVSTICTAVNAHQELVEALKGCLAFGRFIHSAESELAAQRAAALLSKLGGGK